MAKWKQQKLGNPKILEDIGKRADQAIEAVNTVMGIVKTGGEVAKLVLMSSINPALLAMKVVGEAIITMAENYRDVGFYALYVGYGDGSTAETFPEYGLAYLRDEHGNYMFETAYFETSTRLGGGAIDIIPNYSVNANTEAKFVKSLDKRDLSDRIRDSKGRGWRHSKFVLPMPKFDFPWRMVRGGWTPDKWFRPTGGLTYEQLAFALPNYPQISATKVVEAMADAFDDEGDVPLYAWASKNTDINLEPVYTKEGIPVQSSKQQYARIGSTPNPGGQLSDTQKAKWEISPSNWKDTHTRAEFYTHLFNKKEGGGRSSRYGSSTLTTNLRSGKPSFKGVADIVIPAETKLVKTGTAGEAAGDKEGAGGTLGSSIGTYEVVEIAPAKVIPIPSTVVGIAIVAGLPDFQAFYNLLNTLMNFFGEGWTEIKNALEYIESLTDRKYQLIQLEQDTLWGSFEESGSEDKKDAKISPNDRYMMGATSGAVGKIMKMNFGGQSEENRIPKLITKDVWAKYMDEPITETVDTNSADDGYLERWFMHEYKIESVLGEKFEFDEGEYVYQISEKDGGVKRGGKRGPVGTERVDEYWVPSSSGPLSEEFLENKVFKGGEMAGDRDTPGGAEFRKNLTDKFSAMDLPPYGIVTGAEFENPPASVPPDFMGFQFKEFIPYWAEVFDGIAMFGQAIVDIAEALLAFIKRIIDFIDKVIGKLQELANAIISFINYFKIGIPEAGIYLLGVSTSDGNAGIQSALRNADNAPPASLVYSSGILLVGVTDGSGANGVEILGSLLALDFTSVKALKEGLKTAATGVGTRAEAIAELQGTGFNKEGIGVVYDDENSYNTFKQIKSFTVTAGKEGSGYATIPSITIASSGSVVSMFHTRGFIGKATALFGLVNPSSYVESPEGENTYAAEIEVVPAVEEVIGAEEEKDKDGNVTKDAVVAIEGKATTIKLTSPGSGYITAPKIYIGGGGKPNLKTDEGVPITVGPSDFEYHTIITTTLSKAPKAHAILEGDKITKVTLDSTGNSYYDTSSETPTSPVISIGGVPLKSIKITEGGQLYKEIPRLSFVAFSGSGHGAVGEVISLDIKGSVEEIELTSPGEEYTSAPEIKISNP